MCLMGEQDEKISLLQRCSSTRRTPRGTCIYYGEGRDAYDVRGRTAHESVFNVNRRRLSLSELAAGLFALQHLDARAGVGDLRLCGALEFLATVE